MPERADARNPLDVLRDDLRGTSSLQPSAVGAAVANALRIVAPRPVPSVVLSMAPKSAHETARLFESIPKQLDETVARYPVKIELRLDTLPSFSERMTATSLVLRLGVPLILTLRARREGGATTMTEPERQRFLLGLVGAMRTSPPAGSLIDIEAGAVAADPEGWGQVIAHMHEKGFHVMLSHHDLEASPERGRALLPPEGLLDGTPGGGALLWKSATTVRTWSQERALLRAQRRATMADRRAAIMGMGSPVSRLLAPFFAAPLVYAAIDDEHATAPGQMPFADLVHTWARWGVDVDDDALAAPADGDALPPRWALLGRPAWHSLSPAMHNAAARHEQLLARYFPLEVPEHSGPGTAYDTFTETLRDLPNLGVVAGNVTTPFKRQLAETADQRDGLVEKLGAANTFRFDGETLSVTNTDPHGTRLALEGNGVTVAGKTVLVLGSGGAAVAALAGLHGANVHVTNRTPEKAQAAAGRLNDVHVVAWDDRAHAARDADIIVNATSIGMTGGADGSPLPAEALRAGQAVLDLVYAPQQTQLLQDAAEVGATAIDGLNVLLHQGVAAFAWWTGRDAPADVMRAAIDKAAKLPLPERVRVGSATGVEA